MPLLVSNRLSLIGKPDWPKVARGLYHHHSRSVSRWPLKPIEERLFFGVGNSGSCGAMGLMDEACMHVHELGLAFLLEASCSVHLNGRN